MRAAAMSVGPLAVAMWTLCPRVSPANDVGLVGIWRLDEAEGEQVVDSGPNGLHGKILRPEATQRVAGRSGRALLFGGEGKLNECSGVVIPNIQEHDLTRGLTIEAWVRLRKDYTRRDTCYIASNGAFKGPGWRFLISWDSLALQSGDGQEMWGARTSRTEYQFLGERWYHIAGTYDGSVYRVYVDGVERGASKPEASRPITRGSRPLSIGCYGSGRANLLKGTIDEVRIYSRAKSPLEVLKSARVR